MAPEGLPSQVLRPASVARALRHPIRRATLAVVLERETAVPVVDLVAAVHETGAAYGADAGQDRAALRQAVHHRHLPVLALADLVSRRRADAVASGGHRLLSHPGVTPAWLRDDGANWTALGAVFGQPRRRVAVRLLAGTPLPVTVEPLARAVAAELRGDLHWDAPFVDDVTTRLHHVGLPMLDDADVLTYDADATRVVDFSAPDLPLPVEGI